MSKSRSRPFFADFWLKLSALAISLGIWFYANSRLTDEITCRAVLAVSPPQGYALVYQSAKSVRITISGPRSLVSRLDREFMQVPLRVTANLNEHDLSAGQASLTMEQLWRRADIQERDLVQLKFRGASPGEVRVFASRLVERMLPVRVNVSVQTAPGFLLAASPTATPPEVLVRGPALAVEAMVKVETDELPLYDVRSDVQRPVSLRPEVAVALPTGEQVAVPLKMEPSGVTVNVSVAGEEQQEQRFANIRLLRMAPPDFPYQIEFGEADDMVTVVVKASPTNLRKLEPAQVRAYVDLSPLASEQIAPGTSAPYRERVHVRLPPGVVYGDARTEPDRVNILLKNAPR